MKLKEQIRRCLPSAVGPRRILAGPLRGKHLVASWHDYPTGILGRAEPGLMAWFAKVVKSGETWLDLGAHYGYMSLALCHYVGKTGRVFAFEPLLATVGHLASMAKVNNLSQLTIVPLGLDSAAEITLERVQTWKGMAQPVAAASDHTWLEPIYCIALDQIWNRLCGSDETISGVKMDVEGMEPKVLTGMTQLLRKHKPKLVIEVHATRGVSLAALTPLLLAAGYSEEGYLIEPVHDLDRSYEFRPLAQEARNGPLANENQQFVAR